MYAPTATKPATPTLKRPVKPHCRFSPRQDERIGRARSPGRRPGTRRRRAITGARVPAIAARAASRTRARPAGPGTRRRRGTRRRPAGPTRASATPTMRLPAEDGAVDAADPAQDDGGEERQQQLEAQPRPHLDGEPDEDAGHRRERRRRSGTSSARPPPGRCRWRGRARGSRSPRAWRVRACVRVRSRCSADHERGRQRQHDELVGGDAHPGQASRGRWGSRG